MTRTMATLELSATAFKEIADKLQNAGYGHAFRGGVIDMDGIGLVRAAPEKVEGDEPGVAWIGVDLDGTLASWSSGEMAEYGLTHIGPPVPEMAARVKAWLAQGIVVKVLTARVSGNAPPAVREAIEAWTEEHLGTRLEVTCSKDYNMLELWDDRAVQVVCNTGCPVGRTEQQKHWTDTSAGRSRIAKVIDDAVKSGLRNAMAAHKEIREQVGPRQGSIHKRVSGEVWGALKTLLNSPPQPRGLRGQW